jgi:hypothetical protein
MGVSEMAAIELIGVEEYHEIEPPRLRLVSLQGVEPVRTGRPLVARRAARARMLQRRRRTLVALGLVVGLIILALPGAAFGGVTGAGLSSDLANSSDLASGMVYVVQSGDTVNSIARQMNPVDPSIARRDLIRELDSLVVVPGEHVLIP